MGGLLKVQTKLHIDPRIVATGDRAGGVNRGGSF